MTQKQVVQSQIVNLPRDDLQSFSMGTRDDCTDCPTSASSRRRDEKTCAVCGDHAVGFNFGAIACESCKAFFRRNALRSVMAPCLFNNNCVIQVKTRRFCSPCRLAKCFSVGMRKSCIMDEKAKRERREKILRNRERKVAASGQSLALSNLGGTGSEGITAVSSGASSITSSTARCSGKASSPPPVSDLLPHQHHHIGGLPNVSCTTAASYPLPQPSGLQFYSSSTDGNSESIVGGERIANSWQNSNDLHQDVISSGCASMVSAYSSQHLNEAQASMMSRSSLSTASPNVVGLLPPPPPSMPNDPLSRFHPSSVNFGCDDLGSGSTSGSSWMGGASEEGSSSTLPYYIKNTPTTGCGVQGVPVSSHSSSFPSSSSSQPVHLNGGECRSGVKNVLDGHVWTLEPEDPSNKECIALCPMFLKTGMARLLSKPQWTALNDLRSAYETSFLDKDTDHAPENSSNISISSLVNTSGFLVRKFINFAKKLADFSVLGQEGQICLLKGVVLNALFIRSASHYDVEKDVWVTPKGEIPTRILKIATGMQNLYEEHAKYCRNFADVVRKDSHLVALMQVLCLFAPDRPRLSDRQSVSNIYDRYILLLKHYLEARHGFTRGRTLLAAVLTNLAELQALTDNYGHILLHVDPSKVDPLILEVFNLSNPKTDDISHCPSASPILEHDVTVVAVPHVPDGSEQNVETNVCRIQTPNN